MTAELSNIAARYTMPAGEPETWDVVQECEGHRLAKEFAREWMVDRDTTAAVQRLGYTGSTREASKLGKALYAHAMVQQKICEVASQFQKARSKEFDEKTIDDLIYMEAINPLSEPADRIRALALLKKGFADVRAKQEDEDGFEMHIHLAQPPPDQQ